MVWDGVALCRFHKNAKSAARGPLSDGLAKGTLGGLPGGLYSGKKVFNPVAKRERSVPGSGEAAALCFASCAVQKETAAAATGVVVRRLILLSYR